MLRIFSICFATLYGTSLATACVSIEKNGLQHLIVNYCQYPIIAHYAAGNAMTGTTASIPPGDSELAPIPTPSPVRGGCARSSDPPSSD